MASSAQGRSTPQPDPSPGQEIRAQLDSALEAIRRLGEENRRLRARLAELEPASSAATGPRPAMAPAGPINAGATPSAKVALFQSLFHGRQDVYALRWERRDGRYGYSPALEGGPAWGKARRGAERDYQPLTDDVIRAHLTGTDTVGIYPLLQDDSCRLLAIDFDDAGWQRDAQAVLEACDELGVPAAIERSRSGQGAHLWVFFTAPLPAAMARSLGSALLTRAMDRRYQIGLRSYDRLFPNQDTLPKRGLGNLIALPLHGEARRNGNTVFLDRDLQPHPDQWAFLSSVRRMEPDAVEAIVRDAGRTGRIIGVGAGWFNAEVERQPWTLPPSRRVAEPPITEPLPGKVTMVLASRVFVEKAGIPSRLLTRIRRLAAFQNPEFYRAQQMRLSTYGKPRIIDCSEDFPAHLALPRGCAGLVLKLLEGHRVWTELRDERQTGTPIRVTFQGQLTARQREAATTVAGYDNGVLCAPTAFGKTVIAAWLIAERRVNTLVLVHRQHLLDQWRERLAAFLELPPRAIGQLGAGRMRPTGIVDVGLLQSVVKRGEVDDIVAQYGQVIVDECHHIPAVSFERALAEARARFVVGLTATPVRKDGHHPIIAMQCGPVRFTVDARTEAAERPFEHVAVPRPTDFVLKQDGAETGIQQIYSQLVSDRARTRLIVDDVLGAVRSGRSPLVLTERTEHLDLMAGLLAGTVRNVIVMRGGTGARERQRVTEELRRIGDDEPRVVLATGRYIGEGFDDARMDTLFLALPVSWRGTIQQYAGRLHRLHASKRIVQIFDYVDVRVPVLAAMYNRRSKGYKDIGYTVVDTAM